MTTKPRLHELASIAGVSLATVSRVLNAKPGVAAGTRQKVLDACAELGYREPPPRPSAGNVGIVTPELDNPIFPLLAQSIEARLVKFGMLVMVCPATADTVSEQDYLDYFAGSNAAGVVVINGRYADPDVGYEPYSALGSKGISVVLVNGVGPDCPVQAVAVDIRSGGATAVRHLASMGHFRIGALVGPMRYASSQDLLWGYQGAMDDLGLPHSRDLVSETLFTVEGGQAGVAKLLDAGVTAVVAGSDLMAIGAIRGARAWGLSIPEDLSVVGFDGTPLVTYTSPQLTSIRQPVDRMASTVASLLQTPNGDPKVHMFQPDLVIAGTSGRPRRR